MDRRQVLAIATGALTGTAGCLSAPLAPDHVEDCGAGWFDLPIDPGEFVVDGDDRVPLDYTRPAETITIGEEDMAGRGPWTIHISNTAGVDTVCVGVANRNDPELEWGNDAEPDGALLFNDALWIPEGRAIDIEIHRFGFHHVAIKLPQSGTVHNLAIPVMRPGAPGGNPITYVELFAPDDIGSASIVPL